ncbi:MAG: ABC transporter ATP-binding protein [Alphaproteobacteria bacterium]
MNAQNQSDTPDMMATFKRLMRELVRPHLGRFMLAFLLLAVVAATEAGTAWLLDPAIELLFLKKDPDMLYIIPAAVVVIMMTKALATYGQTILISFVGERVMADTQRNLFQKLVTSDLGWLHGTHTGKLISSFLYDVGLMRQAVSRAVASMLGDGLKVIALTGVMIYQDWQLALASLIIAPILGLFTRQTSKRMRKASVQGQLETGTLTTLLTDTLSGTRTVKAYGREAHEISRVSGSIETRLGYLMKAIRVRAAAGPVTDSITGIAIAGVIFYAGWKAQTGDMALNEFVSFLGAMMMAYRPLRSLSQTNTIIQEGLAAAHRVFALLDVEDRVFSKPDAKPIIDGTAAIVNFDNVSFAYDDGTPALHGVSFTMKPGKAVALVGPSGGGKSTILNLIPRFYDVTGGAVSAFGVDVRDTILRDLRNHIALVTQDPFLFDETIAANIGYGREGATQAEIEAAAKRAAAHDFIMELPQGYDTQVGEAGVKLSGGQKQRIAIARAFVKDAPILLLDEATSALDTQSERQVQKALDELMHGRTTLIIAHRLSTIENADTILVIDQGRIAEQGNHASLLAQGGLYHHLYETAEVGADG